MRGHARGGSKQEILISIYPVQRSFRTAHGDGVTMTDSASAPEVAASPVRIPTAPQALPSSSIPSNWAQKWSPEEDERLLAAIREFGDKNWKKVAEAVGSRDQVKCIQRWEKGLKPGIVKGRWKEEEDRMLVYLVSQGLKNWGKVSANMPGRTSKQCRERWNNYLNPTLIHAPFSAKEDATILKMQRDMGNKWAVIARANPGRTENAVKVRFNVLIRQHTALSGGSMSSSSPSSDGSRESDDQPRKRVRVEGGDSNDGQEEILAARTDTVSSDRLLAPAAANEESPAIHSSTVPKHALLGGNNAASLGDGDDEWTKE